MYNTQREIRRLVREMITDTPAAFSAHWFTRASDWRRLLATAEIPETRETAIKFAGMCLKIAQEYRAQIH